MLNMIRGCRIQDPSLLFEGYEHTSFGFVANVNADRIQTLFEEFIRLHNSRCFVILEVPTNSKEEPGLMTNKAPSFHKDVYYMDGLTAERAIEFLRVFGEWVIHDGLSNFGIGIHSGNHEMILDKYNVVTIYTKTPQMYDNFFQIHNLNRVTDLKSAWDFFTPECPGESFLYEYKGNNIYDIIEYLKQYGLYFAERREV